jgi:transposase
MGRPYGDDLRRKFLYAYDQGEGELADLADRFSVSLGWAKKISAQRNRTGKAERVPHQPGRKPRVGEAEGKLVVGWVSAQPDLTLVEIQSKLQAEAGITLGVPRIWVLLRKLHVRLKKSRSTPRSATPKRTESSAKSS